MNSFFLIKTRFLMGYPAATGQGTSRTDATRARDLAPEFCSAGRPSFPALAQQGWTACFFLREGGSRRLRNTGRCALTASRKNGPPVPAAFSLVR